MGRGNGKTLNNETMVFRGSKYDPEKHLAVALSREVLPGAVRTELSSMSELRDRIDVDPYATVVVSDLHGNISLLKSVLKDLGLIDDREQRTDKGFLVSIGDLVDGRDENDFDILMFGKRVFDKILAGNHEIALMGGKVFNGLELANPELRRELERAARGGQLDAAYVAQDVLISHAGFNANFYAEKSKPEELSEAANEDFIEFFYRNSHQPDELFAHTNHRGRGGTSKFGGVFWQDFSQIIEPEMARQDIVQVTGHSALGGIEQNPDGTLYCIDAEGPRVGICVISAGELLFADSHLSK